MPRLSDEQIRQARNIDLLTYLQTYEPGSVRKSRGAADEYYMVEHDSLKISNGMWFRHSTQYGGRSALDFLVKVRGVNFVDAVQSLTGEYEISGYKEKPQPKAMPQPKPQKPFVLPKPNRNNDKIIAYLRGRGISMDIINRCIKAGILYESTNHRCVFVGKDENGIAKFACERGTADDVRKDIAGSSKKFSFSLPPDDPQGNGSTALAVFESPADCLAHHSINSLGKTSWDGHRLSLGGVASAALNGFLERHPHIRSIRLCLDADQPGKEAANRPF
jgi:hypothetical protein